MRHEFRNELLEVIGRSKSKGLQLGVIVRIIYNRHTSLFATGLDFDALYNHIGYYLRRESKKKDSPFVRGKKRGSYMVRRRPLYPRFL